MKAIYTFIFINSNKARYLLLDATLTTHIYFTKYTVSYANSTKWWMDITYKLPNPDSKKKMFSKYLDIKT